MKVKSKLTKEEISKELASIKKRETELNNLAKKIEEDSDITKRVKSFNDILKISGKTLKQVVGGATSEDSIAYEKLKLICQVLNEGWYPKHIDKRWYPYFSLSSGFAFLDSYGEVSYSFTYGGFRLCLKSEKLADFAGKTFTKEFEKFYT